MIKRIWRRYFSNLYTSSFSLSPPNNIHKRRISNNKNWKLTQKRSFNFFVSVKWHRVVVFCLFLYVYHNVSMINGVEKSLKPILIGTQNTRALLDVDSDIINCARFKWKIIENLSHIREMSSIGSFRQLRHNS